MSIRISFQNRHLSIKFFPTVELPDFTLVTGLNGSGKTHFLNAIANQSLTVDEGAISAVDILLRDGTSIVPQNPQMFDSTNLNQERVQLSENILRFVGAVRRTMQNQLAARYLRTDIGWDLDILSYLSEDEAGRLLKATAVPGSAKQRLEEIIRNTEREAIQLHRNSSEFMGLADLLSSSFPDKIYLIRKENIDALYPFFLGRSRLFQPSIGKLFVAYRDELLRNDIKELRSLRGATDVSFEKAEEIGKRIGVPPWEFLNEVFKTAGLAFEIDKPDLDYFSPYKPELTDRRTGAKVSFTDLSSGEKVLVSLAICLYQASDDRQYVQLPKLILFDEVDAHLHPSMSKSLLSVITETLVGKFGIKVIATTHSPSTVALAPEESIYVMRAGSPGLHKETKYAALGLLTEGVPTLSLSFEGRRQVLVESQNDAVIYDRIYHLMKPKLAHERSLEFIGAGVRTQNGDQGAGCDQVKRFAKEFRAAGNRSVLGLIDWDGKHQRADNIFVLAQGRRDGLENCVLDPVMVILGLHRAATKPDTLNELGIDSSISFSEICAADVVFWQSVIDKLQTKILGATLGASKQRCFYQGGLALDISTDYLCADDHLLYDKLIAAYPQLNKFGQNSHKAMLSMVDSLFRDAPALIPVEFRELFLALLNSD